MEVDLHDQEEASERDSDSDVESLASLDSESDDERGAGGGEERTGGAGDGEEGTGVVGDGEGDTSGTGGAQGTERTRLEEEQIELNNKLYPTRMMFRGTAMPMQCFETEDEYRHRMLEAIHWQQEVIKELQNGPRNNGIVDKDGKISEKAEPLTSIALEIDLFQQHVDFFDALHNMIHKKTWDALKDADKKKIFNKLIQSAEVLNLLVYRVESRTSDYALAFDKLLCFSEKMRNVAGKRTYVRLNSSEGNPLTDALPILLEALCTHEKMRSTLYTITNVLRNSYSTKKKQNEDKETVKYIDVDLDTTQQIESVLAELKINTSAFQSAIQGKRLRVHKSQKETIVIGGTTPIQDVKEVCDLITKSLARDTNLYGVNTKYENQFNNFQTAVKSEDPRDRKILALTIMSMREDSMFVVDIPEWMALRTPDPRLAKRRWRNIQDIAKDVDDYFTLYRAPPPQTTQQPETALRVGELKMITWKDVLHNIANNPAWKMPRFAGKEESGDQVDGAGEPPREEEAMQVDDTPEEGGGDVGMGGDAGGEGGGDADMEDDAGGDSDMEDASEQEWVYDRKGTIDQLAGKVLPEVLKYSQQVLNENKDILDKLSNEMRNLGSVMIYMHKYAQMSQDNRQKECAKLQKLRTRLVREQYLENRLKFERFCIEDSKGSSEGAELLLRQAHFDIVAMEDVKEKFGKEIRKTYADMKIELDREENMLEWLQTYKGAKERLARLEARPASSWVNTYREGGYGTDLHFVKWYESEENMPNTVPEYKTDIMRAEALQKESIRRYKDRMFDALLYEEDGQNSKRPGKLPRDPFKIDLQWDTREELVFAKQAENLVKKHMEEERNREWCVDRIFIDMRDYVGKAYRKKGDVGLSAKIKDIVRNKIGAVAFALQNNDKLCNAVAEEAMAKHTIPNDDLLLRLEIKEKVKRDQINEVVKREIIDMTTTPPENPTPKQSEFLEAYDALTEKNEENLNKILESSLENLNGKPSEQQVKKAYARLEKVMKLRRVNTDTVINEEVKLKIMAMITTPPTEPTEKQSEFLKAYKGLTEKNDEILDTILQSSPEDLNGKPSMQKVKTTYARLEEEMKLRIRQLLDLNQQINAMKVQFVEQMNGVIHGEAKKQIMAMIKNQSTKANVSECLKAYNDLPEKTDNSLNTILKTPLEDLDPNEKALERQFKITYLRLAREIEAPMKQRYAEQIEKKCQETYAEKHLISDAETFLKKNSKLTDTERRAMRLVFIATDEYYWKRFVLDSKVTDSKTVYKIILDNVNSEIRKWKESFQNTTNRPKPDPWEYSSDDLDTNPIKDDDLFSDAGDEDDWGGLPPHGSDSRLSFFKKVTYLLDENGSQDEKAQYQSAHEMAKGFTEWKRTQEHTLKTFFENSKPPNITWKSFQALGDRELKKDIIPNFQMRKEKNEAKEAIREEYNKIDKRRLWRMNFEILDKWTLKVESYESEIAYMSTIRNVLTAVNPQSIADFDTLEYNFSKASLKYDERKEIVQRLLGKGGRPQMSITGWIEMQKKSIERDPSFNDTNNKRRYYPEESGYLVVHNAVVCKSLLEMRRLVGRKMDIILKACKQVWDKPADLDKEIERIVFFAMDSNLRKKKESLAKDFIQNLEFYKSTYGYAESVFKDIVTTSKYPVELIKLFEPEIEHSAFAQTVHDFGILARLIDPGFSEGSHDPYSPENIVENMKNTKTLHYFMRIEKTVKYCNFMNTKELPGDKESLDTKGANGIEKNIPRTIKDLYQKVSLQFALMYIFWNYMKMFNFEPAYESTMENIVQLCEQERQKENASRLEQLDNPETAQEMFDVEVNAAKNFVLNPNESSGWKKRSREHRHYIKRIIETADDIVEALPTKKFGNVGVDNAIADARNAQKEYYSKKTSVARYRKNHLRRTKRKKTYEKMIQDACMGKNVEVMTDIGNKLYESQTHATLPNILDEVLDTRSQDYHYAEYVAASAVPMFSSLFAVRQEFEDVAKEAWGELVRPRNTSSSSQDPQQVIQRVFQTKMEEGQNEENYAFELTRDMVGTQEKEFPSFSKQDFVSMYQNAELHAMDYVLRNKKSSFISDMNDFKPPSKTFGLDNAVDYDTEEGNLIRSMLDMLLGVRRRILKLKNTLHSEEDTNKDVRKEYKPIEAILALVGMKESEENNDNMAVGGNGAPSANGGAADGGNSSGGGGGANASEIIVLDDEHQNSSAQDTANTETSGNGTDGNLLNFMVYDNYLYETVFVVAVDETSKDALNVEDLITLLYSSNTIGAGVPRSAVNVTLSDYTPARDSGRRLLSATGTLATFLISAGTEAQMQQYTSLVDLGNLPGGYTAYQQPYTQVTTDPARIQWTNHSSLVAILEDTDPRREVAYAKKLASIKSLFLQIRANELEIYRLSQIKAILDRTEYMDDVKYAIDYLKSCMFNNSTQLSKIAQKDALDFVTSFYASRNSLDLSSNPLHKTQPIQWPRKQNVGTPSYSVKMRRTDAKRFNMVLSIIHAAMAPSVQGISRVPPKTRFPSQWNFKWREELKIGPQDNTNPESVQIYMCLVRKDLKDRVAISAANVADEYYNSTGPKTMLHNIDKVGYDCLKALANETCVVNSIHSNDPWLLMYNTKTIPAGTSYQRVVVSRAEEVCAGDGQIEVSMRVPRPHYNRNRKKQQNSSDGYSDTVNKVAKIQELEDDRAFVVDDMGPSSSSRSRTRSGGGKHVDGYQKMLGPSLKKFINELSKAFIAYGGEGKKDFFKKKQKLDIRKEQINIFDELVRMAYPHKRSPEKILSEYDSREGRCFWMLKVNDIPHSYRQDLLQKNMFVFFTDPRLKFNDNYRELEDGEEYKLRDPNLVSFSDKETFEKEIEDIAKMIVRFTRCIVYVRERLEQELPWDPAAENYNACERIRGTTEKISEYTKLVKAAANHAHTCALKIVASSNKPTLKLFKDEKPLLEKWIKMEGEVGAHFTKLLAGGHAYSKKPTPNNLQNLDDVKNNRNPCGENSGELERCMFYITCAIFPPPKDPNVPSFEDIRKANDALIEFARASADFMDKYQIVDFFLQQTRDEIGVVNTDLFFKDLRQDDTPYWNMGEKIGDWFIVDDEGGLDWKEPEAGTFNLTDHVKKTLLKESELIQEALDQRVEDDNSDSGEDMVEDGDISSEYEVDGEEASEDEEISEEEECRDGVRTGSEECDDGNTFSGDGCSVDCKLEDPGQATFLCDTTLGQLTTCCPVLTNPITGNKTCDCVGQAAVNPGTVVTPSCEIFDVDECTVPNAACHPNAVCENLDARVEAGSTHNCHCAPPMLGDGVARCDNYLYETIFAVAVDGTLKDALNVENLITLLYSSNTIGAGVPRSAVNVTLSDYTPARDSGRRLLSATGTLATFLISAGTEAQMQQYTSLVDLGNLPGGYTAYQQPFSQVTTVDSAFSAVNTVLAGFMVDSVTYSDAEQKWLVDVRYIDDTPNTITGLFLTKVGAKPYSKEVLNTFYVSQHPCMQSISVCCLLDFRDRYVIGQFGDSITQALGSCDTAVQNQHTLGLFDPRTDQQFVDNVFQNYPNSSVHRISNNRVQLVISEDDMRDSFSKREALSSGQTGYRLTFGVGMAHTTLLPANALSTVATQTQVSVVVSNELTFAFSTEQDYTFVNYVTLSLFQNKWVDGLVERYMQFAKLNIVLPAGVTQNMQTGLIPLSSVRFAIAQTLPDQGDESQWTNPCLSSDGSGLYDLQSPWRSLYAQAAAQSCATQHNLCQNPITALLTSNLVEFYFPIGDGAIDGTHLDANLRYNFYVYFDIAVVDTNGHSTVTKLFATATIGRLSLSRSCEILQVSRSLLETTTVDISIGLVGTQSEWDSTVQTFPDVQQATQGQGLEDTTEKARALSLQSGLISLVVRGDPIIFAPPSANYYYINLQHLTTAHFLDNAKYETVKSMVAANEAYDVNANPDTGGLRIHLRQQFIDACTGGSGGDFSCAIRQDVVGGKVNNEYAVHSLATGIGTHDPIATRDWITQNLVGVSEFGKDLASNFTALARSNFGIDDRVTKMWFINPGYNWPNPTGAAAQSTLHLSDKLMAFAIITLNNGQGNAIRRRLLTLEASPSAAGAGTRTAAPSFKVLSSLDLDASGGASHPGHPANARRSGSTEAQPAAGTKLSMTTAGTTPSAASHRRSLAYQPKSDQEKIAEAMSTIAQAPRQGVMPTIAYDVDVGQQMAKILALPDNRWGMVDLDVIGRFPDNVEDKSVRNIIAARITTNMAKFCQSCDSVRPVFYNLKRRSIEQGASVSSLARGNRRLLQTVENAPAQSTNFDGTVSLMLHYKKDKNDVVYSELFRSIIDQSYSDVWAGEMSESRLQEYLGNMQNEQIVLRAIHPSWDTHNTTNIVMDMSKTASASWVQDLGSSSTTTATPVAPNAETNIDTNSDLAALEVSHDTSGVGSVAVDFRFQCLALLLISLHFMVSASAA